MPRLYIYKGLLVMSDPFFFLVDIFKFYKETVYLWAYK